MFGRRKSPVGRQPMTGRQVRSSQRPSTFSYYGNDSRRSVGQRDQPGSGTLRRSPTGNLGSQLRRSRQLFRPAQLPLLLLIAVGLASIIKVSILYSDPKIVFLAPNGSSTQYVQETGVYSAAAQKQLAQNPLNHLKLTADVNGVQSRLSKQFPELEAVSVDLPLIGNRPMIYLTIAAPSVDLKISGQQFRLNSGGVVLAKATSTDPAIPVIEDTTGRLPAIGDQALPGSTVSFCSQLVYQLRQSGQGGVSGLRLPANAPFEIDVLLTGKPYYVRFNLQADVRQQSGAAIAVIEKLGKNAPQQYIDVRVPGRVYYK